MRIVLSPSTLSLFMECPRCFYMHVIEKKKRPQGIFPSLPSGMDKILKEHFDSHRVNGTMPEELIGQFQGSLYGNMEQLDSWRNNLRGLRYTDPQTGATLMGAIDDLFVTDSGKFAPLDFKTRGYPRKEDTHEYYQHQMDLYSFLLEKNGLPPADFAILIFYFPNTVKDNHHIEFIQDPVKMQLDRTRGEKLFLDAVKCLQGTVPEPDPSCEWCNWKG